MMTPGAALLRFRQKFGHGLRTAWYRDVIRPRILRTAPITGQTDEGCEIHVFTSSRDWLNLIWALKSFYQSSERRYRVAIHEDGTLDDSAIETLKHHFPNGRIILRRDADERMRKALSDFPRSLSFRLTNLLAPKVFDFVEFLEAERMLLFDSDLLFFREPIELLRHLDDKDGRTNVFNPDFDSAYTVSPADVRAEAGFDLQPCINSGLGVVHPDSIRWDWTEEFLALPGILQGHVWRIEQTLFALCSSRFGVSLLAPEDYGVYLEPGLRGRPFRHYVGRIRHLMYREGMAKLADTLLA